MDIKHMELLQSASEICFVIAAAALVLALVIISTTGTFAASGPTWKTRKAGKGYVTTFYAGGRVAGKIRTAKRLPVKVLESKKVTGKTLRRRAGRYILVEKINGKCINNRGDGRTSDGYYISYRGIKSSKGEKFTTWCVYEDNTGEDTIAIRMDRVR
jgi:hypothetical protein